MMIRMMLVSLVASLGLELPSGHDVASWTHSGQAWASARMADLASLQGDTCPISADLGRPDSATATAVEPANPASDLAFEAAADRFVCEFRADALAALAPSAPEPAPVVEVASVPTPAVEAVVAESAAPVEAVADPESCELDSDEEDVVAVAEPSVTQADKIHQAVRMTAQAVNAWASVLQ